MRLFWILLVFPWLLDLYLGHKWVMSSPLGALLWGVAVVSAGLWGRIRDPRMVRGLSFLTVGAVGGWVTLWLVSVLGGAPAELVPQPAIVQALTWLHAGLLAAGAGVVAVFWVCSGLWLWQEARLRFGALDRAGKSDCPVSQSAWLWRGPQKLPSLESLSRATWLSLQLAFSAWMLGLVLAFVTTLWSSGARESGLIYSWTQWLSDIKTVVSVFLWLILLIALQVGFFRNRLGVRTQKVLWVLSSLFLVVFVWLLTANPQTQHLPVRWFLR